MYFSVQTDDDLLSSLDHTGNEDKSIMVLHLMKDVFERVPLQCFERLKQYFMNPKKLSVIIIDCRVSMESYEKIYIFDLVYVSDAAVLFYDPGKKEALDTIKKMFNPKLALTNQVQVLDYMMLFEYGLANTLISRKDFFVNMVSIIEGLIAERTLEQFYSIKDCMNAYKNELLSGSLPVTDLESKYFYRLAILKIGESINL